MGSIRSGWMCVLFLTVALTECATTQTIRYDQVIEFYRQKLNADPLDFISAISLGETYTSRARTTGSSGDYVEAEKAYRLSLKRMPTHNIDAKVGLAASLASQHRFKEADAIVKDAMSESPETPSLWAIAGDVAFDLGDYERAAGLYKLYANQKPGLASWGRLARIEMFRGNFEAAGKLWERSCDLPAGSDPEPSAWAWVMRGSLSLNSGDFSKALSCYERALNIMPDFALALEHKAEIKMLEEQFDEAIRLYHRAIFSSKDPGLQIFLGDAFKRAGHPDSAATAWKLGESQYRARVREGDIGYLRPLALYYLDHGTQLQKALELAKKDMKIRQDIGAYSTLARAYLQSGRKEEALQTLKKAPSMAENDPQFCFQAGEIHAANRDIAEAGRLYTRAIELCPAFDRIYNQDVTLKVSRLEKKETSSNARR